MFDKKLKRNAKCSILCCELHYAEKLTFNMGSNQQEKNRGTSKHLFIFEHRRRGDKLHKIKRFLILTLVQLFDSNFFFLYTK